MKKKIIAAVMAITLLLVACAMTISAYNDNGDTGNYHYNINVNVYSSYVDTSATVTKSNSTSGISIRIQSTVVYSDGSYDQGYKVCSNNPDNLIVYYNTSKTISYIDVEVHIYDNGIYMDTISTSF